MNSPATDLIRRRFSCRRHPERAIQDETKHKLQACLNELKIGPFGAAVRFLLLTATERDRQELKGVGTYGVIKNAAGFIVGAVGPGPKNLEDFGYLMERAILCATDLDLGTCWLGGSFTKSGFAKKIAATATEIVPAVASIGYVAETGKAEDWIRRRADGEHRLPAEQLFFEESFGNPIRAEDIGAAAVALDMVRWAPSASNKQPWRIVHAGERWHFYLRRTPGYAQDSLIGKLLGVADVQRVDMGIALCHFELTMRELGLPGGWIIREPALAKPDRHTEYVASWAGA